MVHKIGQRLACCGAGIPVTCDGCGAPVEAVTDAMKHPVPEHFGYGPAVIYIVCGPMPDGRQPCLDVAIMRDRLR